MSKPRPEQDCIDGIPVTQEELGSLPILELPKDPEKRMALAEEIIRAKRKKKRKYVPRKPKMIILDEFAEKKDPAPIFGPISGRILWFILKFGWLVGYGIGIAGVVYYLMKG